MKNIYTLLVAACISSCIHSVHEVSDGSNVSAAVDVENIQQILLLDVQGYYGGRNLWISADGIAFCNIVRPRGNREPGLQATCYSFQLSDEEYATLARLIKDHNFFQMKPSSRQGVADEARPVIYVKSKQTDHVAWKWENDQHTDFDPIYSRLLTLAAEGEKRGDALQVDCDINWKPDGFPLQKSLMQKIPF